MRTFLAALLSAGVMTFSLSASAADMPARVVKAPVAVPMTSYNWTGFYSATGLGGAWTDINGTFIDGSPANTDGTKFNYASMLGAQYQWGNWVVGVEAAYNKFLNKDYDQTFSGSADCLPNALVNAICASRIDNVVTVGPRIGYAWDRWMVFGTGGYANGKIYGKTIRAADGFLYTDTAERHGGWFAGFGGEYFLTKFWNSDVILGVEYQHIDLGTKRHLDLVTPTGDDVDYKATADIVRARLVFKWAPGPAAVVTKY